MMNLNTGTIAWWTILILLLVGTPAFGTLAGILVLVAAIFTLPILLISSSKSQMWQSAVNQPMLVAFFFGFIISALVLALNANAWSDMRFVANFLPFILATPVYLLARKFAGEKAILVLLGLCLLGAFIALLIALNDTQIVGRARAKGYYSGSIVFARNATALGFVAAVGFIMTRRPARYLFLLGPVFAIATTLLAQSRGTLIAFPVLLAMLGWFYLRHAPGKAIKPLLLLSATILLLGLITFFAAGKAARVASLFQIIPDLLQNGSSGDESVNIRLDFYRTGIDLFMASPWIGHGWAQMSELVYAVLNPAHYETVLVEKFHFHNDILNFAVAGGIFGIIAYGLFLCAPLIGALRSKKDRYFAPRLQILSLLSVLYFISGFTDMVIGFDLPSTQFAMLGALVLGAVRTPAENQ